MNIYELTIYVIAMHSAVNKIYCLVSFSCKIHMLGSHNMKVFAHKHGHSCKYKIKNEHVCSYRRT